MPRKPIDESRELHRRKILKGAGLTATAGITALAGCAGSGDGGDGGGDGSTDAGDGDDEETPEKRAFPLKDSDAFSGVELNYVIDNITGPIWDMFGPEITDETGLTIGNGQVIAADQYYSKLNNQLIGGGAPPWDIIMYWPINLGDFQARDTFEPLGKYMDKYEGMQEYYESILPPFREFYTKFQGNIVSLPIDGDILVLNYRPSYFEDEEHQAQYENEYGEELKVPETWEEYNQVAKYFTENTEDAVYGCQTWGKRPWCFAFFMNRAAANGVIYFDEEMNCRLNDEAGVKALENYVESAKYAPSGVDQFGGSSTISHWNEGKVVMSPWWIDLTEAAYRGDNPVLGDQANAKMPGWKNNGSIEATAFMPYGRVFSVPQAIDDSKKEAAFYASARLSHQDVSVYAVADPWDGLDPYMEQHYTNEAAQQYIEPNPIRDTGEGFESNEPMADNIEWAKQHLEGGQANMEIGFPQPNWPGANQYMEAAGIHIQRALAGEESPQEALDATATEWESIVDDLGRDQQKEYYMDFLETAEKLGYWG